MNAKTSIDKGEYDRLVYIKDAALHLAQAAIKENVEVGQAAVILKLCGYCAFCGHKFYKGECTVCASDPLTTNPP